MTKFERLAAWLLLLNGSLGLCAALGIALATRENIQAILPLWSLLGTLAGLLALRTSAMGLAAGLLYYLPQVASFHSRDFSISIRSGISLGWVITTSWGVLVINFVALTLAALSATLIARRARAHYAGRCSDESPFNANGKALAHRLEESENVNARTW
jgi:hypothetical protein